MSSEQENASTNGKMPGKAFVCPVCNRSFSSYYALKKHHIIHTGEKRFVCEICRKRFTEKSTLNKHHRTHTGEKPYVCAVCQKAFSQISHLKIHSRLHTGERPYLCIFCQRTFVRVSELKSHLRVHTQEKPFVCDVCQKEFQHKRGLDNHYFKHSGEKPFPCDLCTKRFFTRYSLKLHVRKRHEKEKRNAKTYSGTGKKNCQFTQYRKICPAPLKESPSELPPPGVSSNARKLQRSSARSQVATKRQPRWRSILPAGQKLTPTISVPVVFVVTPQLPQQQIIVPFV